MFNNDEPFYRVPTSGVVGSRGFAVPGRLDSGVQARMTTWVAEHNAGTWEHAPREYEGKVLSVPSTHGAVIPGGTPESSRPGTATQTGQPTFAFFRAD